MKNRLYSTILISFPVTWIVEFVNEYIYSDWEFAKSICMMVIIDTLMSIVKHIIHKDASSESFWKGFSKKIFIYIMLMLAANVMCSYTVSGQKIGTTDWIGTYLCVAMMVREVISIIENSNAIVPWLPKNVLKRLRDFNDNGEYIKTKDNGNTEN